MGRGYDHIPLYISVKFSRDKFLKICFLSDLRDTVRIALTVKLYINLEDGVGELWAALKKVDLK